MSMPWRVIRHVDACHGFGGELDAPVHGVRGAHPVLTGGQDRPGQQPGRRLDDALRPAAPQGHGGELRVNLFGLQEELAVRGGNASSSRPNTSTTRR
jgi:hypothetical protein